MIHSNQLAPFTIIKVKKHIVISIGQQTRVKVVLIKEVEIVTPGIQVGLKLGNPAEIPISVDQNPNLVEVKLATMR